MTSLRGSPSLYHRQTPGGCRHTSPHVTDGGAQGGTRGQGQGLRGSLPQAGVGPGAAGQGVISVHPSLLLPQEGPRHGQMVLLGGAPWASIQPDPTALRADLVALSLRPAPPPPPARKTLCPLGGHWLRLRGRSSLFPLPGSRGGTFSGSSPLYRCESWDSGGLGAPRATLLVRGGAWPGWQRGAREWGRLSAGLPSWSVSSLTR